MRIEFDQSVPVHEQLYRVSLARQPGRKHQKRKGVKASQRARNKTVSRSLHLGKVRSRFSAKVRDYWLGISDTNPAAN